MIWKMIYFFKVVKTVYLFLILTNLSNQIGCFKVKIPKKVMQLVQNISFEFFFNSVWYCFIKKFKILFNCLNSNTVIWIFYNPASERNGESIGFTLM